MLGANVIFGSVSTHFFHVSTSLLCFCSVSTLFSLGTNALKCLNLVSTILDKPNHMKWTWKMRRRIQCVEPNNSTIRRRDERNSNLRGKRRKTLNEEGDDDENSSQDEYESLSAVQPVSVLQPSFNNLSSCLSLYYPSWCFVQRTQYILPERWYCSWGRRKKGQYQLMGSRTLLEIVYRSLFCSA